MIKILQLINKKGNRKAISVLNNSKEDQIKFLEQFDTSDLSDLERSYNQYICQIRNKNKIEIIMLNIFCSLAIIPSILFFGINGVIKKRSFNDKNNVKKNAIFWGINKNIIPDSLIKKYKIIKYDDFFALNIKDIKFIINQLLIRKPFSFYFNLKIITKLAIYSGNIYKYNPETIIATSEYSFTSSMLTKYCNENNILHINVMHGDKLFNIRDSFFRFNKCYIWDKHYKELFIKMNAEPMQFSIEIPSSFLLRKHDSFKIYKPKNKKLTYYLQHNSEEKLLGIKKRLKKLDSKLIISIRPHPLYSNMVLVNKVFKDFNIENIYEVNIKDSIIQTDYVVSLYSTVLLEAHLLNKNVVIDDLVDEKYYHKLKELDYIMINKPHIKLSEMINKLNN